MVSNTFYEARITLIQEPEKDIALQKEKRTNIPDKHRCKIPQQVLANQIQPPLKKMIGLGLFQQRKNGSAMKEFISTDKSVNKIQHLKRVKDKNHTTILTHTEKAFVKIPHPFMTKKGPNELSIEWAHLSKIRLLMTNP
jgi:hypothetical protein